MIYINSKNINAMPNELFNTSSFSDAKKIVLCFKIYKLYVIMQKKKNNIWVHSLPERGILEVKRFTAHCELVFYNLFHILQKFKIKKKIDQRCTFWYYSFIFVYDNSIQSVIYKKKFKISRFSFFQSQRSPPTCYSAYDDERSRWRMTSR